MPKKKPRTTGRAVELGPRNELTKLVHPVIARRDHEGLQYMLEDLDISTWPWETVRELFDWLAVKTPIEEVGVLVVSATKLHAGYAAYEEDVAHERKLAELLGVDAAEAQSLIAKYNAAPSSRCSKAGRS